jgi:hypothetical protein
MQSSSIIRALSRSQLMVKNFYKHSKRREELILILISYTRLRSSIHLREAIMTSKRLRLMDLLILRQAKHQSEEKIFMIMFQIAHSPQPWWYMKNFQLFGECYRIMWKSESLSYYMLLLLMALICKIFIEKWHHIRMNISSVWS